MEIPGFKQDLDKARKVVMDENPNLTSPEATSIAAIDALDKSYNRIEKFGGATFEEVEEVKRREKLIKKSPAQRAANVKLYS